MAGAINLDDIGTVADPSAAAPQSIGTGAIPTLSAPIPIEAGGSIPQIQPPTVSSVAPVGPPPPAPFQVLHPGQDALPPPMEPLQIDGPSPPLPVAPRAAHGRRRPAAPSVDAPGLASSTLITGTHPGLLEQGNVDLTNRPDVLNQDGSHSSVRSMSFEQDGREILVPTVSEDGRIMSDAEAMAQYDKTGKHLGIFKTPADATRYGSLLHRQQEAYGPIRANRDGTIAPDLASIREPSMVEKVVAAEGERARLEDQKAQEVAKQADAEAHAALARADEQKRQTEEQDRLISQQRDAMVESKRVRDAARSETKNFKFHSYWADKSTGQKILSGIAVMLGGVSWDQNHVNQAADQIGTNIQKDFQKQEIHLKNLQKNAQEKAGDTVELARQHQEEWNKLKFKQGEQLVAVGNQFDVMAMKAKGSQKVLEAKQLAQQYRATGQALIQNTETNIAKMHLIEAQTKHALSQANEANAKAHFHRLTAGSANADKAAAHDDAALQKAVKDFDKQHGITGEKGLGKQITDLGEALSEAKAPVQNPLTQLTTLDKLIRSATGLGVRGQVLKTYMDHLGGLRAQGESKAQAWVNGTVGKRAWQNVIDHIGGALSEKEKEAQAANENFGRVFKGKGALPFAQRRQETVGALEQSMFGQMPGFGRPAQSAPSPAGAGRPVTLKDGRKGFLAPDGVTFTPAQ